MTEVESIIALAIGLAIIVALFSSLVILWLRYPDDGGELP
jgi:uncharacterized iron-regulated membrane protein